MLKSFILHNRIYNEFPIVVHFPGVKSPDSPLWNKLILSPFSHSAQPLTEVTLITWNNTEKGPLEKSLDRLGVEYVVLGKHIRQWKNIFKLDLTAEFLQHVKTPYVIGLDSIDTVVLSDPNEIVRRFKVLDCNLLFNSQSYCFPRLRQSGAPHYFVKFEDEINEGRYTNAYLNAGAWVGTTEFCRVFFGNCKKVGSLFSSPDENYWSFSEQAYVRATFPFYFPEVKLDYRCRIFQVLEGDQSMIQLIH